MNPVLMNRLGQRMRGDLRRILATNSMNTATVVVYYQDSIADEAFDPNLEATYPERVEKSREVKALVYFFGERMEFLTGGSVNTGDLALVLNDDEGIPGTGHEFELDGKRYVQKPNGGEALKDWDVLVGGERFAKVLLLQLKR